MDQAQATQKDEKPEFESKSINEFIPGYTGHCPSLKFSVGTDYSSRTHQIIKDMKHNREVADNLRHELSEQDLENMSRQPITNPVPAEEAPEKVEQKEYKENEHMVPQFIAGYTGFVPSLAGRHGKSYGRATCDSMNDFHDKQQDYNFEKGNVIRRANSQPDLVPERSHQEVLHYDETDEHDGQVAYEDQGISSRHLPISGYMGHIPCVVNEETMSRNFSAVAKEGFSVNEKRNPQ